MHKPATILGNARRAPRGFTLVELLVAIAISSFIAVTVFFMTTSSSRTFRVQADVSQVGDHLSFALDTIKGDLRRTSYLTLPNAYLSQDHYPWFRTVCAPPPWAPIASGSGPIAHAIQIMEGSGGGMEFYEPLDGNAVLDGQAPDQLLLLGAYRTTHTFHPSVMQSGGTTLQIPNGPYSDADMVYMFKGSMLQLTTPAGGSQYLSVTDVQPHGALAEVILTLGQPIHADPTGTGLEACNFTGFGGANFEAVPLHFIRYSVARDPSDRRSTVLVREELGYDVQPLAIPSRYIVARGIVDMQVWVDGVASVGDPNKVLVDGVDTLDPTDDEGTLPNDELLGDTNSRPESARHAYVQLSARLGTPVSRIDPSESNVGLREFVEMEDCSGANCFGIGEFTRVMTMRGEVDLHNIALANLRADL